MARSSAARAIGSCTGGLVSVGEFDLGQEQCLAKDNESTVVTIDVGGSWVDIMQQLRAESAMCWPSSVTSPAFRKGDSGLQGHGLGCFGADGGWTGAGHSNRTVYLPDVRS